MYFEQRVQAWSKNIIHHLGQLEVHDCYRMWQHNVKLDPTEDGFKDAIKGHLFFTENIAKGYISR